MIGLPDSGAAATSGIGRSDDFGALGRPTAGSPWTRTGSSPGGGDLGWCAERLIGRGGAHPGRAGLGAASGAHRGDSGARSGRPPRGVARVKYGGVGLVRELVRLAGCAVHPHRDGGQGQWVVVERGMRRRVRPGIHRGP